MSDPIITRISEALRRSTLHRNVGDSFESRSREVGIKQGVDSLYADEHDPETIAAALADALHLELFQQDAETISEQGNGYLLTSAGGLFLRNPVDDTLAARLTAQYGDRVSYWGVLPFAATGVNNDDAQPAAQRENDRVLDSFLVDALSREASDVHFSAKSGEARVRYRINGRLTEVASMPLGSAYEGVINRILARAGKEAGAYAAPTGGKFHFRLGDRRIPIRVEQLPTQLEGERHPAIVLRLQGGSASLRTIEALGFPDSAHNPQLKRLRALTRRPDGLVLATGPTSAGKTSTLYAMLQRMQRDFPVRAFASLEDPVEIESPGVDQTEINEQGELTFAAGLKSLLRRDPDVILLGEIRDQESAQLAVRASLTGHFVLSTLHTRNAPASIPRLLDMGLEPRLLADTLSAVIAQRMVTKVCHGCARWASWDELARPEGETFTGIDSDRLEQYQLVHELFDGKPDAPRGNESIAMPGTGCSSCSDTGFSGRCIITETLYLDSHMRDLVAQNATPRELINYAKEELAFVDMWGHAILRVRNLEITLDEALDSLPDPEP